MHNEEKESEIMKREIKRSLQQGKGGMKHMPSAKKTRGVNKTGLHKADNRKRSKKNAMIESKDDSGKDSSVGLIFCI